MVGGTAFQLSAPTYTTTDSGQSVVTAAGTAAGLTVSRKITVPNTGSDDFARTIDTFTNSTGSTITTTVTIVGNLGSNAATNVFATSDGTGVVSPNDQWIGTDDASDGSGTPAVIHYHPRPVGLAAQFGEPDRRQHRMDLQSHRAGRADGPLGELYHRRHDPGGGHRLGQRSGDASTGFGGQAAAFLSPSDLGSLANFSFTTLPEVARVSVRGEQLDEQFLGRWICHSRGQRAQLLTLPWGNINQIKSPSARTSSVDQSDLLLIRRQRALVQRQRRHVQLQFQHVHGHLDLAAADRARQADAGPECRREQSD